MRQIDLEHIKFGRCGKGCEQCPDVMYEAKRKKIMPKVVIKSIKTHEQGLFGETFDETVVEVDGKYVGGGSYGGEPEDNMKCRDYSWVEATLVKLAEALGAEVVLESEEINE